MKMKEKSKAKKWKLLNLKIHQCTAAVKTAAFFMLKEQGEKDVFCRS